MTFEKEISGRRCVKKTGRQPGAAFLCAIPERMLRESCGQAGKASYTDRMDVHPTGCRAENK